MGSTARVLCVCTRAAAHWLQVMRQRTEDFGAQPPTKINNAVLHAQAAMTIAVLALGVAMHARLLALFRLLTQGGSVLRNLLVRPPHLRPNDSLCIQPPCPRLCSRAAALTPCCPKM